MSWKENLPSLALITIIIVVSIIPIIVYGAFMTEAAVDYEGLFANVLNGLETFLDNPIFLGWIVAIIVAVGGWLENYVKTKEKFDPSKWAETFFYYEPALILLTQWFPTEYAVFLAFGIDVARRIAVRLRKK